MSTDYSIVCLDCKEDFGWDGLTNREAVELWLKDASNLADVCEAVKKCQTDLAIDIGYNGCLNPSNNLQFFLDHKNHHLVVMNEYEWFEIKYGPFEKGTNQPPVSEKQLRASAREILIEWFIKHIYARGK